MRLRVLMALAAVACSAGGAQAGILTGAVDGGLPGGTLTNGPVVVATTFPNNNDYQDGSGPGPLNLGPNPVSLKFNVTSLNSAFGTILSRRNSPGTTEYLFDVELTNNTGKTITKLDVNLLPLSQVIPNAQFDEAGEIVNQIPAPSGGTLTSATQFQLLFNSVIINGATKTFTFSVDVLNLGLASTPGLSTFRLNFVAHPEPASLALASLASCGIGGLVVRRRRKLAQTAA